MNTTIREIQFPSGALLQLVRGDIMVEQADAIVNAANRHLQHGGGVAGAIARKGGETIQRESDQWVYQYGPVPHNQPAYTSGGKLACTYVIHAVGPVWGEGDEDRKLQDSIEGSLHLAEQLKLSKISLPAISTGIFGFPKDRAARIILSAAQAELAKETHGSLMQVRIVIIDTPTIEAFEKAWVELFDHLKA